MSDNDFIAPFAPPCTLEQEYSHGLAGLVFDCDGVLFDSKEANTAYYNHIRAAIGLPPMNRAEAAYAHMVSTTEALERMIPEELHKAAFAARDSLRYRDHFMSLMRPAPAVFDCLAALHGKGLRLALCTNRSDSVHDVLTHFGMDRFFSPVVTISRAKPKPYPDGLLQIAEEWRAPACDIAFVGDSLVDQQASAAAGVPFWSFANPDLHARLHVDSFSQLGEMLLPVLRS